MSSDTKVLEQSSQNSFFVEQLAETWNQDLTVAFQTCLPHDACALSWRDSLSVLVIPRAMPAVVSLLVGLTKLDRSRRKDQTKHANMVQGGGWALGRGLGSTLLRKAKSLLEVEYLKEITC